MAIKLTKDKNVDNIADEESNGFEPLPKGKYPVTIYDCEVAEFGPTSKNAGDPGYRVQFRVSAGQYENRRIFTSPNILLSGAWASGADNFSLFNFLEAVQVPYVAKKGIIDDDKGKPLSNSELRKMYKALDGEIELPDPEWLLSKPLTLVLGIQPAQGQYEARNRINRYEVAQDIDGSGGGSSNVDDLDDFEEL